jgi:hypothetical protein
MRWSLAGWGFLACGLLVGLWAGWTPRAGAGEGDGFVRLFAQNGAPTGWVVRAWDDLRKPAEGVVWKVEEGVLRGGLPRGSWLISVKA